ncbi:MAG: IclR family transcriptional regulator [Anaerolineae bacterium]|nr:IclR family transcriptional regulator [Anaerolineae bacterium]
MGPKEDRYNIRVLDRAISILSVLSDGKPRTLMELSEAVELNSSTTFRLLSSLASHSYVERDEQTGKYALGLACLELARAYQMNHYLRRAALPELEALRDETGETIHLAVLDRMDVVYLEKLHGLHAIGLMSSQVGARLLAYCTGLGKVLLAYIDPERIRSHHEQAGFIRFTDTTITDVEVLLAELAAIREQGYALDRGEHEPDVRCIAAPIQDAQGKVIAALSIAGPASRMEPIENNPARIDRILQSAQDISSRLGYRPTPDSRSKQPRTNSHAKNHQPA